MGLAVRLGLPVVLAEARIGRSMAKAVLEFATIRTAARAVALSIAVLGLTGCGVRGSLEAPRAATADGTAKSAESADPGANSAAPKKPHEGFILDGLIR